MTAGVIRLSTPGQMAEASVWLRQAGDDHHAPLFQAAMREELRFAFVFPDGRFPKHLLCGDRLPCALVLCDDDVVSLGPSRFPQARRLLRWARRIVVHAAGEKSEHYALAVEATVGLRPPGADGVRERRARSRMARPRQGGRRRRTPRLHITPRAGREASDLGRAGGDECPMTAVAAPRRRAARQDARQARQRRTMASGASRRGPRGRQLRALGLDWHELVERAFHVPSPVAQTCRPAAGHRASTAWLFSCWPLLSAWERRFVNSVHSQARLTPKQAMKLPR